MYLSKLEIYGFKSFAQKTKFEFSDGMCALVGPNGCGKTNVVDAIRWVLGEQKTSVLRSDVMENVLFNGTSTRKPISMSEVTLTLQNNKKILPIEYEEVNVTRRLFRNGESQYLLNKAKCRLRDIVDLFMDTGMGADSYSVIELKMVEAILSGKPEERRHLFEEAAGVGKYKFRRKEASRKLESVETDLTRLEDIVTEVEKNVNSLSRQAAKTRRYNKLLEELNSIELEHLKHEFYIYNQKKNDIERDSISLRGGISMIEQDLTELDATHNELNTKRFSFDDEYKNARRQESELSDELAQKREELAVSNEKLKNLDEREARLNRELSEAEETQVKIGYDITQKRQSSGTLKEALSQAEQETSIQKNVFNKSSEQVKKNRDQVSQAREDVLNIENKLNSINELKTRNISRKSALEQRISESNEVKGKINSQDESLGIEIAKSEDRQIELEQAFISSEQSLNEALDEKTKLQNEIDELRLKLLGQKTLHSQQSASLEFLSNLVNASESTEYLMKTKSWKPSSEKNLLAELIATDEKYKGAVNAALGEYGGYFVVDNYEDALSGIKELTEKQKGKTAFICLDRLAEVNAPCTLRLNDGEFGLLSEIARTDEKCRNILRILIPGTLLVKDRNAAEKSLNNDNGIIRAVTLKGEIFDSRGIIYGGGTAKDEVISIGKKERINLLTKEISKLQNEINKIEEMLSTLITENDAIDIRKLSDASKQAEGEKMQCEQLISKLKSQRTILQENLSLQTGSIERYRAEMLEIDGENPDSDRASLESELHGTRGIYNNLLSELSDAENNLSEMQELFRAAEHNLIKLQGDLKNINNEILSLEKQKQLMLTTVENRNEQIEYTQKERTELTARIEELTITIDELQKEEEALAAQCDVVAEHLDSIQEQLEQCQKDINEKRKSHDNQLQAVHQIDLKLNESSLHLNNLNARAVERFETNLNEIEIVPDENFNIEESRKQVQDIRVKLGTLGSVNFLALEEYDKESERLNFYHNQLKDLKDSKKTLEETITEINQTAEEKFLNTYGEINKNFSSLFTSLFGGDAEALLRLAEGNPLEADIEIIAKPPGKKPHSVEMISSGEKTLTAIALLFSIYLVKPSPFCILDEVDAPLDDANIDRFINLIREFSRDTQFLIITHNKRTMEAADTLYGITMQEEGVSKVVSVRLTPAIIDKVES